MSESLVLHSGPSLGFLFAVTMIVWTFPIGAFVLRRHFAHATGAGLVAKWTTYTLAMLSAPAAFFILLIVVTGAFDAYDTLRDLFLAMQE